MPIIDEIALDILNEGVLSSANMKSQLTTVLMKIFNGKTDMASGKDIGNAIKQVRGVSKVAYLFSIEGDRFGVTYYQHRYIVEDNKNVMYQIDVWNRPMDLVSRTTVKKMYDKSSTKVPDKICKDFISEYLKLAKKGFVGYASISKNTLGIYMYSPERGKQDKQIMDANYEQHSSDIQSIINKIQKKYADEIDIKSNNELVYK